MGQRPRRRTPLRSDVAEPRACTLDTRRRILHQLPFFQAISPAEIAQRIGLDVPAFRACLAAPETQGRLAEDIGAALQAGVKATPSYVIAGKVYSGEFPAQLLPPVASAR